MKLVPLHLEAVLKMQVLAVNALRQDDGKSTLAFRSENICPQHQAVTHRNWHILFKQQPMAAWCSVYALFISAIVPRAAQSRLLPDDLRKLWLFFGKELDVLFRRRLQKRRKRRNPMLIAENRFPNPRLPRVRQGNRYRRNIRLRHRQETQYKNRGSTKYGDDQVLACSTSLALHMVGAGQEFVEIFHAERNMQN